jgi:hypothetical protein
MRHLIFVSYSHQDQDFLDRLLVHLAPYKQNSSIKLWSDQEIRVGELWRGKIQDALSHAQAAILLVSPEFLASEFIQSDELPPLLKAAQDDGLVILWVPVSSCSYRETPIASYQAASDPTQPLRGLTRGDQDRMLVKICGNIIKVTWSLRLELDEVQDERKMNREVTVQGRASFRANTPIEDLNQDVMTALREMRIQLIPFVFAPGSGWWAQPSVEPSSGGGFQGKIWIGGEGTDDVGKSFQVRICALSADLSPWERRIVKLPQFRIESNTITVKRT